jgi:hypothetical protein
MSPVGPLVRGLSVMLVLRLPAPSLRRPFARFVSVEKCIVEILFMNPLRE